MKIKNFEDILSWQKSQELALKIYKVFKDNRDYSFKDQIKRAVVSISNNIAEGFERNSNKELVRFLYIARGSCGEVRSMIYLARNLNYLSESEFKEIYQELIVISKLIFGFIRIL